MIGEIVWLPRITASHPSHQVLCPVGVLRPAPHGRGSNGRAHGRQLVGCGVRDGLSVYITMWNGLIAQPYYTLAGRVWKSFRALLHSTAHWVVVPWDL